MGRVYSDIGRNLLAVCFIYRGLDTLLHTQSLMDAVPSFLGVPYFWVALLGCVWIVVGVSFVMNVMTRTSGLLAALTIVAVLSMGTYRGLLSPQTAGSALLQMGFYAALLGGALMVAARDDKRQPDDKDRWHWWPNLMFVAGRVCVSLFFIISGVSHFVYVKEDAQLISFMPGAEFWVAFVGLCWLATAVSMLTNMMTKTSAVLTAILIVVITLSVTLQGLGQGDNLRVVSHIMQNVGLIGACFMAGSKGRFWIHCPLKECECGKMSKKMSG